MIALVQRFRRRPGDPSDSAPPVGLESGGMREEQMFLRAMAVAGFAAGNLLLLSVAAWIGQSQNMGPVTRDLLHWVAALIAVPAILYAGQPFFTSALKALGRGRANSDLSISLAVGLAAGLGLFGNLQGAPNSGFDAAVVVLFFLLIGRHFEQRARNQIPSAAKHLLDGLGLDSQSEAVQAIALAEQREARHPRLAEGIMRLTPPGVLALTLAAFLAWGQFTDASWGASWQEALLVALSVLIVAGPCTLLSAIPAAQMIASTRLMRRGILLKSASALARLAKVDTLVFDKTGGLTCGQPVLLRDPPGEAPDIEESEASDIGEEDLQVAASLAASSRHPLAAALRLAAPQVTPIEGVSETPSCGLSVPAKGGEIGLGSRQWCDIAEDDRPGLETWLTRPGRAPLRFRFDDPLRGDAKTTIDAIKALGCTTLLLSGDRPVTVEAVAQALGIETWAADYLPAEKSQRLQGLASQGRRILMVGDSLEGATPEPAATLVAVAPLTATEIRESGADAVIQGERLEPLLELLIVARRANRVAQQTFILWFGYNAVALPLALLGLVTPLNAAIALSAVSILAIGNALRLNGRARR